MGVFFALLLFGRSFLFFSLVGHCAPFFVLASCSTLCSFGLGPICSSLCLFCRLSPGDWFFSSSFLAFCVGVFFFFGRVNWFVLSPVVWFLGCWFGWRLAFWLLVSVVFWLGFYGLVGFWRVSGFFCGCVWIFWLGYFSSLLACWSFFF